MDDDVVFMVDLLVDQKVVYVLSLVSLKLNDLSFFFVFNDSTVALEGVLPGLQDSLEGEVTGESLDNSNTLTSSSLLNTNV